ncbi:MAG: hypothetical protein GOMPHAMPRED_006237 [Gomphillus americanus]|uniref:Terpene synthase n=1 Tax=Gomphillus americanus TaxID=1940652 RepID=A0A8H3I9Z2_9LECA|nr:MAG: hypothetical protein GOMPHAMPRED_006237 [Gomphillus americanus]
MNNDSQHVSVRLPKLFVSFLSEEPRTNPHYQTVKPISEDAIVQFCNFNDQEARAISTCSFSYFMAVVVPDAEISYYRVLCDWGNWVFPFDDLFDNGYLCKNKLAGRSMMDALMQPMLESTPLASEGIVKRPRILAFHDTVWYRMQLSASQGTLARFIQAMKDYTEGVVAHTGQASNHTRFDCEKTLQERRKSAGVTPVFALAEYALQLDMPDEIMQHPIIKEIRFLGVDFVVLHNDILSYRKEELDDVPHNMVASCRRAGMTAQQAFDHLGNMLTSRHLKLTDLLRRLPSWDPKTNGQAQRYIDSVLNTVRANLYWSYVSGRYFGSEGDTIKQTGQIMVLRNPPWLHSNVL